MEKLELLLAVRDDTNLGALHVLHTRCMTDKFIDSSVRRKKRKLEGDQLSPPGAFSSHYRQTSPTSATEAQSESLPFSGEGRKRSYTKSSSSTSASTNRRPTLSSAKDADTGTSGAISASTKEYVDPARVRREVLAHQLPLQKGRKVAFRQPNKNKVGPGAANVSGGSSTRGDVSGGANGTGEEDGETWIMATVIECINNDRNRYVVQDDEDAAMPTYNTTLKAVVPLPENLHTLPLEDYKVGTQVLGLYPDTSCFYRATVQGGGPGLNGKVTSKVSMSKFFFSSLILAPQMQRRAEEVLNTPYALEFEDDEGAIRMVPANLVVERP